MHISINDCNRDSNARNLHQLLGVNRAISICRQKISYIITLDPKEERGCL